MDFSTDLWPGVFATFGLFLVVGFFAQLIDGAVGMAYGVISSSVLLFLGVPPAQASATIHAAECFTTGASGASHLAHRNVDWKLFFRLAPAGVIGGVLGAYLLTGFDPTFIKAVVIAYLGVLGVFMLWRALRTPREEPPHLKHVIPLGIVGGFLDASGGGGLGAGGDVYVARARACAALRDWQRQLGGVRRHGRDLDRVPVCAAYRPV
jgi:uncharacterized membrane protein YfcA